jgi:hypothetical protein
MFVLTPIGISRSDRDKPPNAVKFLTQVRPILAQRCFQCHGPDESARKGKLRLDLQSEAFAERKNGHAIAPGKLAGSLVWERITADDENEKMPPVGEAEPLTKTQLDTIKAWIEQGAQWQEHWSFQPPRKPAMPKVVNQAWVRDPLDAFVLERLEREKLEPETEATREAWLRRVSFDLTGLPPTPAEIDGFLKDKSSNAWDKQVDRLLSSPRYGERQAQIWLDLARYADSSGYQSDAPRNIWKWREWVINSLNANMPYDQFVLEQLAGDLLPNATLAQKVATGFNRNHPTNSEAGEEEDEYRSAYVIDRVNTTATTFLGLTLACAQCHDHKYDPISQRDYYSFYSFFNNVKERDTDVISPRPSIPVPNPDQAPRLADLKTRIDSLKARLDRDDPTIDAAQKEWEKKTRARLGEPVKWTTVRPAGMNSRNGSLLKLLDDGSILSTGLAPVRDTYDVMVLPGKQRIAALRLEVLPDDSNPEKALGRATDGRFVLSGFEIRNTTFSESQEPPLVYMSRAEADINQKLKEDPATFDMIPGSIQSAVVADGAVGSGFGFGGGWTIVNDERRKAHEAIFLPLDPLETNDASVLRFSLHQNGGKFKSLISRFRISYTDDNRVREWFLPAQTKLWSSLGPFPSEDVTKAFKTVFEPEKGIKQEPLDLKASFQKVVLPPASTNKAPASAAPGSPATKVAAPKPAEKVPMPPSTKDTGTLTVDNPPTPPMPLPPMAPATAEASKPAPNLGEPPSKPRPTEKKENKEAAKKEDQKVGETVPIKEEAKPVEPRPTDQGVKPAELKKSKPEKITWIEQRRWRDGSPAPIQGVKSASYLTRKVISTAPRTAMVEIDGVAGFKIWLNGELVQSQVPDPSLPQSPPKPADKKPTGDESEVKDPKPEADDDKPADPEIPPDITDLLMGRQRSKTAKRFRVGLRQGENEIVLKVVLQNDGAFTFNLTAEGDDMISYEVATAVRLEVKDPLKPAEPSPILSPALAKVDAKPVDVKRAIKEEEPKKVSLVGEKSAPLTSGEEENKLTPTERRQKVLREFYRSNIDTVGRILAEELTNLKREERLVKAQVPQTLIMEELEKEKSRQAYIFLRGLYKNRGPNVEPTTPAVLPPMPKDVPRNRLGLAQWLMSPQHPLTARVLVNRIWMQYFGNGIVRTAEDFGIRGEPPTHPELLDYLATELVDSKWDLKKLHKRIVLSATYRQSSTASKAKIERDPENLLLARGPRMRLTAEMIRDNALSVSGLLFEKIGGESIKPMQPANAWKTVEGMPSAYRRDRDEKQYRRALYVYWKRGSPYPSMLNFDAAKRDACTVTRANTTTPLQALTLLNDPVYVECAKMLGQRMIKAREAIGYARDLTKAEEDKRRLTYGFRLCTSRPPTDVELSILQKLLDDQRAHFTADAAAAKKLLAQGDAKIDESLAPAEVAAWATVGSTLLNLDATIRR